MTGRLRFLFLIVLCLLSAGALYAQPQKGVAWVEPIDLAQGRADLMRMRELGVESVRTGLVQSEDLLTLADRLGLQFYQELPVAHWPGSAFRDSLRTITRLLDRALSVARRHPSARHFGLAYGGDTANPLACSYMTALSARVRQQLGSAAQTYYTTLMPDKDRCAASVDLVMVDLRHEPGGASLSERWREASSVWSARAIGVAAVGYPVGSDRAFGLRHPESPQSQARYIEDALGLLFGLQQKPQVVFAYQWRDQPDRHLIDNPFDLSYGLISPEGKARPALSVLAGFYTGKQTVFAFPAGSRPESGVPWTVLIGWIVIITLSIYYALSPRLRMMVPRYFMAHGFYRDAVREGRDLLLGSSFILLLALSYSFGMLVLVTLKAASGHPAYVAFFSYVPSVVRGTTESLIGLPLLLLLVAGVVYALATLLWSVILAILSRGRYFLQPGQSLMLVVWPRWPLLLLMLGAMVVAALPEDTLEIGALALIAAWVLFSVFALLRTLYDYATITRVPAYFTLFAAILHPSVLVILFSAILVLLNQSELEYLLRLIN